MRRAAVSRSPARALALVTVFVTVFVTVLVAAPALAHQYRPTLLRVDLQPDGAHSVTWKWDGLDPRGVDGTLLRFPNCEFTSSDASAGDERLTRFRVDCDGGPLVVGFARPPVEVVVDIRREGEPVLVRRLMGVDDAVAVSELAGEAAERGPVDFGSWLILGAEHILFGWDHLCFVIALAVLVVRWRRIALVVTGFTLGHSVTLVGATLAWLPRPSSGPVEAVIALSILYLAVELMRGPDARERFGRRLGFAVSSGFGLVHGFGFAGALSEFQLPAGSEVMALAGFNIGVELGQLAVVAVALGLRQVALGVLAGPQVQRLDTTIRYATAYVVGAVSAYWLLERTIGIVS